MPYLGRQAYNKAPAHLFERDGDVLVELRLEHRYPFRLGRELRHHSDPEEGGS